MSSCLAINEEKNTNMSRCRMQSRVIQFLTMKFPCELGGVFCFIDGTVAYARQRRRCYDTIIMVMVSARVTAGFDRLTPALTRHVVISKYSSGVFKSLNGVI